jgi:hypothetical protein
LEALKLPDDLKRHALLDLDDGHLVVIPALPVFDGLGTSTAYFACDNQTGDITGVLENGLHGAMTWQLPATSPSSDVDEENPRAPTQSSEHLQRALAAWNSLEKSRPLITGSAFDHETLQALKKWADATDVEGGFLQTADNALADRLTAILKLPALNSSGAAARPVFQIGYVTTTNYLGKELENADVK